jgi:sterol desaturase/sphingolipid hydroxylase (fatty acid hydroxylase superfamily)
MQAVLRNMVAVTVFPAMMFGSCLALHIALESGGEIVLWMGVISVAVGLSVMGLERIFPYTDQWLDSQGDLATDAGHMFFSTVATSEVLKIGLFFGASTYGVSWLADTLGWNVWPHHWPMVAQLALALVVGEFGQYWTHRIAHEREFLWRLHATHHSPGRLYWLNAGRFHPLDTTLQYAGMFLPLAALGVSLELLAFFSLFTSVHGLHQHANIEMRLGPLNWIFSMAELHRWHHSRTMEEANNNYGANVIVWDIVFGTRFLPNDREPPTDIGLADMPHFPQGFWAQLASPFRWKTIRSGVDQATDDP